MQVSRCHIWNLTQSLKEECSSTEVSEILLRGHMWPMIVPNVIRTGLKCNWKIFIEINKNKT